MFMENLCIKPWIKPYLDFARSVLQAEDGQRNSGTDQIELHSRKLRWTLKMVVLNRNVYFQVSNFSGALGC